MASDDSSNSEASFEVSITELLRENKQLQDGCSSMARTIRQLYFANEQLQRALAESRKIRSVMGDETPLPPCMEDREPPRHPLSAYPPTQYGSNGRTSPSPFVRRA
jgi:hypothetical protein